MRATRKEVAGFSKLDFCYFVNGRGSRIGVIEMFEDAIMLMID